jgi:PAS domain S-box-containing protein
MSSGFARYIVLAALVAVYFVSGKFGLLLASVNASATPVWPPTGIALAAVILLGYRVWPAVFIGAFLVNATASEPGVALGIVIVKALGIGLGNTLEALAGGWCVNRLARGRHAFDRVSTVFYYVFFAGVVSATISASAGVLTLLATGLLGDAGYRAVWFTWWMGNLVSALIFAPFIIVWAGRLRPQINGKRGLEALGLLAGLWITTEAVFSSHYPVGILILPFLVWAALRFQAKAVTAVVLIAACVAILHTLRGNGPFAMEDQNTSLLLLQTLMCVITVASLALAAAVTERNAVETALRREKEQWVDFGETAPVGLQWVDPDGAIRWANQSMLDILCCDGSEYVGRPMAGFVAAGGDPERVLPLLARGEAFRDKELRLRAKDGSIRQTLVSASPYTDGGKFLYSRCFLRDITERKEAEAQVQQSERRFRQLAENIREVFYISDMRVPRMIYISPAYKDVWGRSRQSLYDNPKSFLDSVHPDDLGRVSGALDRQSQGQATQEEYRIIRPDGAERWVWDRAFPVLDESGNISRVTGIAEDITERKEAEMEIRRLNAELEERVGRRTAQLEATNKELEAFSYSVSHDLRAPLRSIRGFSEVLAEQYGHLMDSRGQDFLQRTCIACQQMDRLIDDLLKLSRVSRSELRAGEVNLSALAESVAAELNKCEPDREVEIQIAPGLQANGDERLLRLVLENLLRNAWKFTGRRPRARIEFGRADHSAPAFFVRDNGAGFDMTYADRLFGVFQRLHSSREFPGTGVGLATVQRIINRHGGRTWAEGKTGQGATFYFTLPPRTDF